VLDQLTITLLASFSGNQQGVANGINAILAGANPNDSFNSLLGLTGTPLINALTQLAGTTPGGATTAGMQLMNGFLSLMSHPSGGSPQGGPGGVGGSGFGGAIPYAGAESPLAARSRRSLCRSNARDGAARSAERVCLTLEHLGGGLWRLYPCGGQTDVGTADTNARALAVAGGAEYKLTPQTTLGFALAGGGTSWGDCRRGSAQGPANSSRRPMSRRACLYQRSLRNIQFSAI
jgi:hypothetical protein